MKKIAVHPDEYTPYGQRQVYTHGWLMSDLNGDGVVDSADESIVSAGTDPAADLDGDGNIDGDDLAIVQANLRQALPVTLEMRFRNPTRTRTLCSSRFHG